MNPVHTLPFNIYKIHFSIILHPRLDLPSGAFPSGFLTKTFHAFLLAFMRSTCSINLNLFGH
jgi:hypothetical protein